MILGNEDRVTVHADELTSSTVLCWSATSRGVTHRHAVRLPWVALDAARFPELMFETAVETFERDAARMLRHYQREEVRLTMTTLKRALEIMRAHGVPQEATAAVETALESGTSWRRALPDQQRRGVAKLLEAWSEAHGLEVDPDVESVRSLCT